MFATPRSHSKRSFGKSTKLPVTEGEGVIFFPFCYIVSGDYQIFLTVTLRQLPKRLHNLPPWFPLPFYVPFYEFLLFCFGVVHMLVWILNVTVSFRFSSYDFSLFFLQLYPHSIFPLKPVETGARMTAYNCNPHAAHPPAHPRQNP